MYWRPWRWTGDGWLGAGLAAALTGLTVVTSLWLEAPFVAFVAAVGVPIGAIVGGWAGSDVVRSKHPFRLAIRTAAQATLFVVTLLMALAIVAPFTRPLDDGPGPLVDVVFGLVIGPVYVLVFGFPAALTVAVVAVAIRRAFGARRRHLAAVLGVTLAVVAIAGGALAADGLRREARRAAGLPDLEAAGWLTLARAATRLEYVLVNNSRQALVLAINETTGPGESGGSIGGIGPCSIHADRVPLGPDWSVHVAPDSTDVLESGFIPFDLPPIASSADTPGRDPRIRIDIAADGSISVTRGQPLPPDEMFLAEVC